MTEDVITLHVTWEDILWQMLSCCGLTVFYVKIVKVIKLFKNFPQRTLGDFLMIIIIYFYNYYYHHHYYYYLFRLLAPSDIIHKFLLFFFIFLLDPFDEKLYAKAKRDVNLRGVTNMKSCKVGLEVHFKDGNTCTKATDTSGRMKRKALGCWLCFGTCIGVEARSWDPLRSLKPQHEA